VEKLELVFYAGCLIFCLKMWLESLVSARRYRGRLVRPGLRFLFILWLGLAAAWLAGIRLEVALTVPSIALYAPMVAAVAASFYYSAEDAYNRSWGPPEPEQPAFGSEGAGGLGR
jgi:hypothetical protein